MNNKTIIELSINCLHQISGGAETLPEVSSLVVYPDLSPYMAMTILPLPIPFPTPPPAPSPAPDNIFWPNMSFVYPL